MTHLPVPCQHSENAPCIDASDSTIAEREGGIVMIDMVKAKGNKALTQVLPLPRHLVEREADVAQRCISARI